MLYRIDKCAIFLKPNIGKTTLQAKFYGAKTDLDKPQNAADPEHPNHPKQRGRNRKVYHNVLHEDAQNGRQNQQEIEHVPGHRKIMVPQPDYLHNSLCQTTIFIN